MQIGPDYGFQEPASDSLSHRASLTKYKIIRRTCPACKSLDVRRSEGRASQSLFSRLFFSAYRCRTCRQRFFVISRSIYYGAALLGVALVFGVFGWTLVGSVAHKREGGPPAVAQVNRFMELTKLAQAGNAVAQYKLARMYRYGDGVTQDPTEENRWMERAAKLGNTDAQFELGMILREGKGVIQDYDEGLKWLEKAARGGNSDAQHELGLIFFAGRGVAQDQVQAYVWLNLAAAGGATAAARTRDSVMRLLSPAELAAAQSQARRLSEAIPRAK